MSRADVKWMNAALSLAKRAWGMTSPNPLVGAVVVKDDRLVGRGWHRRAGGPHAEIHALREAGDEAKGATLFVTLEPCSTTGRTPPCVDAIVAAGVARVVVGSDDPNPAHAGKGFERLRDAGIQVVSGVQEAPCRSLNEAFAKWITTGEPFTLLKMAMTLDGKIATENGDSQWITGPVARRRVHRLRQWADGIMVGGETVRRDHPSLTARDRSGVVVKSPRRLVASKRLEPDRLAELMPDEPVPELIHCDSTGDWRALMKRLGGENVTALLVEGGGELAASMLRAGVVDRVEFHIAPKILGGAGSRPVVGGKSPDSLAESLELVNPTVGKLGNDVVLVGDVPQSLR